MYVYLCICMYYACMCVYVCMYHTFIHDAYTCMYSMNFFYKITLFNVLNGFVRGPDPLDPPLVKMHKGNSNLTMADSKL